MYLISWCMFHLESPGFPKNWREASPKNSSHGVSWDFILADSAPAGASSWVGWTCLRGTNATLHQPPTQGSEIYKNDIKWSWRDKCIFCRMAVVSFLLPCSWICCCFVYPTLFRLRFSFWLLVGSTSLVPVGPFLLHAVLAVDMK